MFSQNMAQTGKTVYGGGGFAPNRGRVSAMGNQGYVRRSLTQQTRQANMHGREGTAVGAGRYGNDGQSDTRSGLARAAMNRVNSGGPMQSQAAHSGPVNPNGGVGGMQAPQAMSADAAASAADARNNSAGNTGGGPAAPAAGGTQAPQVTIGANGQMQLPYDATYGQALYTSLAGFNDKLLGLQQEAQGVNAKYVTDQRQRALQFQQMKQSELAQNAKAGMAFSTQHAKQFGDLNTANTQADQDLTAANAQYNTDVGVQRQSYQDQFQQQLDAAAADHAKNTADSGKHVGKPTNNDRTAHQKYWKGMKGKNPKPPKPPRNNNNNGGGTHIHIHNHNHGNTPPRTPRRNK